jgi:predicted nucleotidyltransferase
MPTFDWSSYTGNLNWLPKRTIFLTVHGSHAYGLATETSDVDIKGVAIPPAEYFYGFLKRFEQAESKDPDMSIYDIRKFFDLAAQNNPNILELLWVDDSAIIQIDELGKLLRLHRDKFLSTKVRHTYGGYAYNQLKRLKSHRAWVLSPREDKPTRAEFGLPETSIVPADIRGAIEALDTKGQLDDHAESFGPMVMEAYRRERAYHNEMRGWQQYQNWKVTRNPIRAEMERKFGYDGKFALHLVRLLKSCREILTTGQLIVKRPDREELLSLREGAWSYERLIGWAEEQESGLDELAKQSPLPHSPDRNFLQDLCCQIVSRGLSGPTQG